MARQLSMTTRRELTEAVGERYRRSGRNEKREILNEFVEVTGYHRKHAIRVLCRYPPTLCTPKPRRCLPAGRKPPACFRAGATHPHIRVGVCRDHQRVCQPSYVNPQLACWRACCAAFSR